MPGAWEHFVERFLVGTFQNNHVPLFSAFFLGRALRRCQNHQRKQVHVPANYRGATDYPQAARGGCWGPFGRGLCFGEDPGIWCVQSCTQHHSQSGQVLQGCPACRRPWCATGRELLEMCEALPWCLAQRQHNSALYCRVSSLFLPHQIGILAQISTGGCTSLLLNSIPFLLLASWLICLIFSFSYQSLAPLLLLI